MASLQTRITAKLDGFHKKLAQIAAVSKRTLPDELNKQLLQVVVGAKGSKGLVQLTKKATAERIRSDLAKTVTFRTKGGKAHTGALSRVLAIQWLHNRGDTINEGTITAAEQAIIKARIQSRAYIAASWLWSAQALAQHVKGHTLTRIEDSNLPTRSDGTAYNAFGKTIAATPNRMSATVFNTARGAEIVAAKAVPRALGNATRDMQKYIARKWGEEWARSQRGITA